MDRDKMNRGGARIFWFGEGGTSDRISYMNSTKALFCNGVAKIYVRKGGTFNKIVLIKYF